MGDCHKSSYAIPGHGFVADSHQQPDMDGRTGENMYIGDLHIHSRYSRATSRDCTPEYLDLWARKKGIHIVGTGDFTHPAWREELVQKLEPAEDGLYVLKPEYRIGGTGQGSSQPRFVVTGEISSIYKKAGQVRKVHSLLVLPGLQAAEMLARRLELIGNIHSDGRPILGIPCRDLLEILLETAPEGIYVPAHIWTPHFSLFGAFSGFETIEKCFEDLTPHIHALETGLSSDPPMNWRVGALDRFHLISNSDAHSPARLGREANLLDIDLSYQGLAGAIQKGDGLAGTIEFFPEEGKYHFDGHRKCGLCISPRETERLGNRCPVCGKKITIGVLNRVEQLADRKEGYVLPTGRPFESLVPLLEVIAASMGISAAGKKAAEKYEHMIASLGPEFAILREVPVEDIRRSAGPLVAEGVRRLRQGQVERMPGFDGEYGKIGLLTPEEISGLQGQMTLFTAQELRVMEKSQDVEAGEDLETVTQTEGMSTGSKPIARKEEAGGSLVPIARKEEAGGSPAIARKEEAGDPPGPVAQRTEADSTLDGLNQYQREAVERMGRCVTVIAGPRAGKTRTLIARLKYLLEHRRIASEEITAVTFTNKAAEELRVRVAAGRKATGIWIGTFHAICSRFLQEAGRSFVVADESLQLELAEKALKAFGKKDQPERFLQQLSRMKNGLDGKDWEGLKPKEHLEPEEENHRVFAYYQKLLLQAGALDYDDLLLEAWKLLETLPEDAPERRRFSYLLIDEFQDINPLQHHLVREWGRYGRELFVIGDPDQSIYGFRGCDPGVFRRLEEEYPEVCTLHLEANYRSDPAILAAALGVISHNPGGVRRMYAARTPGDGRLSVRIVSAGDPRREAIFVAREIARQVGGMDMLDTDGKEPGQEKPVRGFSDMAVLCRTHRQTAFLENCLRQEGIPYLVAGREDFLQERKVRAAIYFFRHILYPGQEEAKMLCHRFLAPILGEAWEEKVSLLTGKYQKRVRKTRPVKLLEEWNQDISLEGGEAMKKLADMSVLSSTMEDFLETLSFGEDGDLRRSGGRKYTADVVTLMTLHGSKGLEFPVVFLYGMDKGRFPLEPANGKTDVEEERRLCYVGMTRAREELILVCGEEASSFLREIPEEYARWERNRKEEKELLQAVQMSLFDTLLPGALASPAQQTGRPADRLA